MALFKRTLSLLLAFAFALGSGAALAERAFELLPSEDGVIIYDNDPSTADSDFDGIPDAFDSAIASNAFSGRMKSGHDGTTAVSFTADHRAFFRPNTEYDPALASLSVIGSALAYYKENYGDAYFTYSEPQAWEGGSASKTDGMELMRVLGFSDVADYTLDSYGDDDICEMIIGHRMMTYAGATKEVIAIWVRGTEATSMEEWSSNFNVGDLVRFFDAYDSAAGKSPRQSNDDWTRKTNHRGFDVCASRLLGYLKTYYLDQYVNPSSKGAAVCYWLTGHSRGAAVADIMSSYLIDEGAEVYCYTFAAPYHTANTEASAEKYDCIFNLVNSNDFVPMLPMPEWGFTRYGRTASVDASAYAAEIRAATNVDYSGKYLTQSDMTTLIDKFVCITGENADRSNPGRILGWREVYVYHCGHEHDDETCGNYQSTTFCPKQSLTNWGGPTESGYNGYAVRLRKYSYWHDGICETPAYDLQVLVELMVAVANGETLGGASTFITRNKLAAKFDFDKWSLISYASKLTEPHFMDTYSVIQAQIGAEGGAGARFHTLPYYTSGGQDGRPVHTHTYTCVPYEGQEPTCEEAGFGYRYCACSEADPDYYDDYQKNVIIPALGHEWGEPVYEWAQDLSLCAARRACTRDEAHIEEETAQAVYEVVSEPTLDGPGLGRYTAHFENAAFGTVTADEAIPQLEGFTVTFADWDGTVLKQERVVSGGAATPPDDPERDGYTFIGWEGDYSCVTADTVITALYEQANIGGTHKGDADLNGVVNVTDALLVVRYSMNITPLEGQGFINGDMNNDGIVNVTDAILIMRAILTA